MREEVPGVFSRPRFQGLSTELQVSGQLPVVSESDVVIFPIADTIPQLVRFGDILRRRFRLSNVGISAAEVGKSHRKFRIDFDGALQE